MRHPSWREFSDLLSDFVELYGGVITDTETGKRWDPGQAVCREAYGPDWSKEEAFRADDELPDSYPVPEKAMRAIKDMISNGLPEWAKGGSDGPA